MKKIVVLSGAGMSAESGLKTFRDNDGLWENYDVMQVATPEAWQKDPKLVLEFYNARRAQVLNAEPNEAHYAISALEASYDVQIITQNIDDLHERAGSSKVLHLHGIITKARSSVNDDDLYDIESGRIEWGDLCARGSQLRPHVVWFGESVPNILIAEQLTREADILIVIGTSLAVYPAAGLIYAAPSYSQKYLIDPGEFEEIPIENLIIFKEKASIGMTKLASIL